MWEWMLFFSIIAGLIVFMMILPDLHEIPEQCFRQSDSLTELRR